MTCVTATGRRVVVLHVLVRKSRGTPRRALATAKERMTRLKEPKARFMVDQDFREKHPHIDGEYALIETLVRARMAAKLTRAELAARLGTTKSAVARLEGGRVSPSFPTLRRHAEATGARLTAKLVPVGG